MKNSRKMSKLLLATMVASMITAPMGAMYEGFDSAHQAQNNAGLESVPTGDMVNSELASEVALTEELSAQDLEMLQNAPASRITQALNTLKGVFATGMASASNALASVANAGSSALATVKNSKVATALTNASSKLGTKASNAVASVRNTSSKAKVAGSNALSTAKAGVTNFGANVSAKASNALIPVRNAGSRFGKAVSAKATNAVASVNKRVSMAKLAVSPTVKAFALATQNIRNNGVRAAWSNGRTEKALIVGAPVAAALATAATAYLTYKLGQKVCDLVSDYRNPVVEPTTALMAQVSEEVQSLDGVITSVLANVRFADEDLESIRAEYVQVFNSEDGAARRLKLIIRKNKLIKSFKNRTKCMSRLAEQTA